MTTSLMEKPKAAEVIRREPTSDRRQYRPNVDIVETADELTVFVDLPGVKAEDVDINFENGFLTIVGKAAPRWADHAGKAVPLVTEYGIGDFLRTFEVSERIDAAKITAEHALGVLTVHLPKGEAIKPRKIALSGK